MSRVLERQEGGPRSTVPIHVGSDGASLEPTYSGQAGANQRLVDSLRATLATGPFGGRASIGRLDGRPVISGMVLKADAPQQAQSRPDLSHRTGVGSQDISLIADIPQQARPDPDSPSSDNETGVITPALTARDPDSQPDNSDNEEPGGVRYTRPRRRRGRLALAGVAIAASGLGTAACGGIHLPPAANDTVHYCGGTAHEQPFYAPGAPSNFTRNEIAATNYTIDHAQQIFAGVKKSGHASEAKVTLYVQPGKVSTDGAANAPIISTGEANGQPGGIWGDVGYLEGPDRSLAFAVPIDTPDGRLTDTSCKEAQKVDLAAARGYEMIITGTLARVTQMTGVPGVLKTPSEQEFYEKERITDMDELNGVRPVVLKVFDIKIIPVSSK